MSVTISCPECHANLKLPSRKLLGRRGKCPKCQHRFVLEEPNDVVLELAEPDSTPGASQDTGHPTEDGQSLDASDFRFANAITPSTTDKQRPQTTSRQRRKKKKRGDSSRIVIGSLAALFAVLVIGVWWFQNSQNVADNGGVKKDPPVANEAWNEESKQLAAADAEAETLSPTSGDRIPLNSLPFSPHLIFHIRPSVIWGAEDGRREFVATLGDLGIWLEDQIHRVSQFEPVEIEELTFALNFGTRNSKPEFAAIVRLHEQQSTSDLLTKRLNGQPRTDLESVVYESGDHSYLQINSRTFITTSSTLSRELYESRSTARAPSVELDVLYQESDRQRQMTLLFDIANIDTHREYILEQSLQKFSEAVVTWFGSDAKTVSVSFHQSVSTLFLDTLVHPSNDSSVLKLQRHLKLQTSRTSNQVKAVSEELKPVTVGFQKMLDRFPAMLDATVQGTSINVGPGFVRLTTLLPAKAAANLAAASLITWSESELSSSSPVAAPAPAAAAPSTTIKERLQLPVIVDFRRMPLQEAFAYIAEEMNTPIQINGDALKLAGMTQNMPQTYDLGEVTAKTALETIISNPDYRGMLLVIVDEAKSTIEVTSRTAAEESGLKPETKPGIIFRPKLR